MNEREGEPTREPKGKKEEEAPRKPGKRRVEKEGKEPSEEKKTVYESKKAEETEKQRELLFKKAIEKAKKEGIEVDDKELKKIIAFLKKKKEGEEISKDEEASILELLLALLKFLWKQIKEYLQDEGGEFADLIEAAEAAGCKTPEEMVKWMFKAFDLSPEEEKGFEKAIKEAEEGKELEPEEIMALKGGEEISEGVGLSDIGEGKGEVVKKIIEVCEAKRQKIDDDLEGLREKIEKAEKAGDDPLVEQLEGEMMRKRREWHDISRLLSIEAEDEREIADYLGRMYGTEIKEIYNKILDVEEAGVFQILTLDEEGMRQLADTTVLDEKTFVLNIAGKEVDLSKYSKGDRLVAEIKELQSRPIDKKRIELFRDRLRVHFVKPLFEEIISDAESDPREGFQMKGEDHILFGTTLMKKLRDAGALGADEKRRFENFLWTRRIFSFLNSELIRGGDPEEIARVSGKLLLSEDLDTIAVMEPSLTPALNVVERILARVRMDPENKGQIPYDFLIPNPHGGYRPPEIERIVKGQLLAMDKSGLVNLGETKPEKEKEALRVAALAVKTSNVFYRSAEHVAQTQLAPRKMGEVYMSYPFDKVPVRLLRLGPERFETWGRGREGAKPWVDRINKYVQGGVYEKIPGETLDEWEINFENYLQFGGPLSGSHWRSLVATKEQRSRGVALGVDLYDTRNQAKRLTRLEEKYDKAVVEAKEEMMRQVLGIKKKDWDKAVKKEDKAVKKEDKEKLVKKALDVVIWKKVGERFPTVIARYFPTLSLVEAKNRDHYFDFKGRLRDGIISDDKKDDFIKYVDKKVGEKFEEEEIWKEIEEDVKKDIESKFIKKRDRDGEIKRRTIQRKRELRLQVGAEASFNWMLADQFGISTSKEGWEEDVFKRWEVLQEKLTLYEEYALQKYVEDSEGYGKECAEDDFGCRKKRDERYKGVLELIGESEKLPKFSKEEEAVVRRLTNLGAKEAGEAVVGAKRLAGVEFSFLPFMEDVIHEKAEWWKIGPRGVSRRIGGDAEFAKDTDAIMTKIDNGLFGPEDKVVAHRKDLVKSFFEVYAAAQHLSEGDRQKVIAAKVESILENLYKADGWTKLPLIGPILDWGGPMNLWKPYTRSSNAQRKFGVQALSMTSLERYQFINDLRPLIGNDRADELLESQKATLWRHVIPELVSQWSLVVGPVLAWQLVIGPFLKELGDYLRE